jgi:predicted TIM-barrel fold metal-dependent hydrolase
MMWLAALAGWLFAAPSVSIAEKHAARSIVDCHVHLWSLERPEAIYWIAEDDSTLRRDFLPRHFSPIAAASNVEGVVIVQAGQHLPDNQWCLDITRGNPTLYRSVVGNLSKVIGTAEFKPLLDKLCEDRRYVGFRLSGRYHSELTDAFFRDLQYTADKGRVVDILVGDYTLADVDQIAARVPRLKIMLDHLGNVVVDDQPLRPEWIKAMQATAKHPNVFCKVSALYGRSAKQPAPRAIEFYEPALDVVFDCFGDDRVVFGSDWPVSRTTGDYASVVQLTRRYADRRGAAVSAKLFRKNANIFYQIDAEDSD